MTGAYDVLMGGEMQELTVKVHYDDDDMAWAEVVELPGCFASGESAAELTEAIEEAIALYLAADADAAQQARVSGFSVRVGTPA